MATILLAAQKILKMHGLEEQLTYLGYQVAAVPDSMLTDMVKRHPFDAVILSLTVSGGGEEEMICQLRMFTDAPIIGVCAEETTEAAAFYMRKCLDGVFGLEIRTEALGELIEDHLREAYKKAHDVRLYQYKNLKISNGGIKKAEVRHQPLDLTVTEFMILSLLMCHRNRIYTKASLYESVWRQVYTGDDNAIKIHISNLRNKLKKADPEERYIETVWGLGYRLCKD